MEGSHHLSDHEDVEDNSLDYIRTAFLEKRLLKSPERRPLSAFGLTGGEYRARSMTAPDLGSSHCEEGTEEDSLGFIREACLEVRQSKSPLKDDNEEKASGPPNGEQEEEGSLEHMIDACLQVRREKHPELFLAARGEPEKGELDHMRDACLEVRQCKSPPVSPTSQKDNDPVAHIRAACLKARQDKPKKRTVLKLEEESLSGAESMRDAEDTVETIWKKQVPYLWGNGPEEADVDVDDVKEEGPLDYVKNACLEVRRAKSPERPGSVVKRSNLKLS